MVPAILIYLLKANIALTLFYLAYRFGLRRLTFYTLNRLFLLFGIAFSAAYPFISIDDFINRHETLSGTVITYIPDFSQWQVAAPTFSGWSLVVYIFWVGVGVMAVRLVGQLWSLFLLHRKSQSHKVNETVVQVLKEAINPFSFFSHIYINPSLHQPEELQAIIHHESVHVKQWHSLDVLIGEINNIFYWFNPGAWLMKSAIRENLEFITDRHLLSQGVDKVAYQYSLIKVSGIPNATAIANNFNFSHLKNRIFMMNSKRSSSYQLVRYLVLGSLAGGLVLLLNYSKATPIVSASLLPTPANAMTENVISKPVADTTPKQKAQPAKGTINGKSVISADKQPLYIIDGRKMTEKEKEELNPNMIKSMSVLKSGVNSKEGKKYFDKYGDEAKNGIIVIELKKDKSEKVEVHDKPSVQVKESNKPAVLNLQIKEPETKGESITITAESGTQMPFREMSKQALVLIDGRPYDPVKDQELEAHPYKVASINVIKGGNAVAIYGSRAKNGVIMVNTTSNSNNTNNGKPEEVRITINPDSSKIKN